MEIEELYSLQINELKKLSYTFYDHLCRGGEPLTYSFRAEHHSVDTQVEINSRHIPDATDLVVDIGFDTGFGGRFSRAKGSFYTFHLTSENEWILISDDGTK